MIHTIEDCETNCSYIYNRMNFEKHNHVDNMDTKNIRYVTYIGYIRMEPLWVLDILPMNLNTTHWLCMYPM